MSRENVGILRDAYAAFDRGEANVLLELLDPEIEWKSLEDTEPKHGTEGVLESVGVVDGKISAFREYKTHREAHEAAGLV